MKPKGTIELFEEVINTRGVYLDLGIGEYAVKNLRRNHKAGKVTMDRMHEILKLAGYKIAQPTLWVQ